MKTYAIPYQFFSQFVFYLWRNNVHNFCFCCAMSLHAAAMFCKQELVYQSLWLVTAVLGICFIIPIPHTVCFTSKLSALVHSSQWQKKVKKPHMLLLHSGCGVSCETCRPVKMTGMAVLVLKRKKAAWHRCLTLQWIRNCHVLVPYI